MVALPIVSYLTVTVVERLITGVYDTFLVKVSNSYVPVQKNVTVFKFINLINQRC